jgi:hypothetical protein
MAAIRCLTLALFVPLVIGATASAEPLLLAELTATAGAILFDSDAPTGGVVQFHVGADGGAFGPGDNVNWEITATAADLGRTFTASPDFVTGFDAFAKGDRSVVLFGVMFNASGGIRAEVSPESGWSAIFAGFDTGNVTAQAFVPQRGPGLTGYRVTGVEQLIHRWFSIRSPSQPSQFGHTVRIFGEVIPEPACVVSALIAGCVMGLIVRRR